MSERKIAPRPVDARRVTVTDFTADEKRAVREAARLAERSTSRWLADLARAAMAKKSGVRHG